MLNGFVHFKWNSLRAQKFVLAASNIMVSDFGISVCKRTILENDLKKAELGSDVI
jgi:hypothetical protein